MPNLCKLVRYSGAVQGVGFRYTALRLAGGFDVSGYVKNLSGGDVELLAEGPENEVAGFLAAVRLRMGSYVADVRQEESQSTGQWKGFTIRF